MRPKLGELLVRAGLLTQDELQRALDYQKRHPAKRKLGDTILALRMVSERDLLAVLAKALRLPTVDLTQVVASAAALETVSAEEAIRRQILPYRIEVEGRRKRLCVAMADPSNLSVIDELQFRCGMAVNVALCTATQIRNAVHRFYGASLGSVPMEVMPAEVTDERRVDHKVKLIRDGDEVTWTGVRPAPPSREAGVGMVLRGYTGPAQGLSFVVPRSGSVVVGRSDAADQVVLDQQMSRRHFMIVDGDDGAQLFDLGSTNGTLLNGQSVRRAPLNPGDQIDAGSCVFRVLLVKGDDPGG